MKLNLFLSLFSIVNDLSMYVYFKNKCCDLIIFYQKSGENGVLLSGDLFKNYPII